jgi:cytochrome b
VTDGRSPTIEVWDGFARITHWTLVVSVAAAWFSRHAGGRLHDWLGYAALGLVLARFVWGCIGPHHARFRSFVRSPAATFRYARRAIARNEPRHIGHNPLGAWMILALMVSVVLIGATGWLSTTDEYWGVEWVARLHDALSSVLLALIALHVAGVAYSSWRHRENLIAAMVHGRKRAMSSDERD